MSRGTNGAGFNEIAATNDEIDVSASELNVGMPLHASSASALHQQVLLGADFALAGELGERLEIFLRGLQRSLQALSRSFLTDGRGHTRSLMSAPISSRDC